MIPLTIKATVNSRATASVHLERPGDAVIVDRQGPRWLVLCCPCGCGAEVPVNLDRRAGPAWRIYESPKGTSVYPFLAGIPVISGLNCRMFNCQK